MSAPPAVPGPLSRLCRGYRLVALLVALLVAPLAAVCAASGPASAAAQRPRSTTAFTTRTAAKPVQAATGTKPLVFMGLGTMAGLTLLAGAGLVASVRRRRGDGPPADRC
ncbi:hypothetical protein [Streptomyces sp. NPDC015125]|uniref:hypothetical protein n=1 Tax=Streptomyces sp. NPDC015125 TaxID=3364938 RepID=UPI003702F559